MLMREQRGFGMLEALISMVVIMIGVLGMVGMQMLAINNTENARYQSIAAMQASSMSAQMLANIAYWGAAPATVTVINTTVTGIENSNVDCVLAVCTAAQMAHYDVRTWGEAMRNGTSALPSGQGEIKCVTAVSPAVCTIRMEWMEKNIALTNATGTETGQLASGKSKPFEYQTMVSIQ